MSSAGADNEAKEKEPLASPGVFSPPVRANSSYTRTAYEKFDPTLYKRICYDGKLSTRLVGAISLLVFWVRHRTWQGHFDGGWTQVELRTCVSGLPLLAGDLVIRVLLAVLVRVAAPQG